MFSRALVRRCLVLVVIIGVSDVVPEGFLIKCILALGVTQLAKELHHFIDGEATLRVGSTFICCHARIVPVSDQQEDVNLAEL